MLHCSLTSVVIIITIWSLVVVVIIIVIGPVAVGVRSNRSLRPLQGHVRLRVVGIHYISFSSSGAPWVRRRPAVSVRPRVAVGVPPIRGEVEEPVIVDFTFIKSPTAIYIYDAFEASSKLKKIIMEKKYCLRSNKWRWLTTTCEIQNVEWKL